MNFNLQEAIDMLERTPKSLEAFLSGLSESWLKGNEGADTWNAEEVVGHLLEAEKTNWIPRLRAILDEGDRPLPPFDRYAHLGDRSGTPIEGKLQAWRRLREHNVSLLKRLIRSDADLERTGTHPAFGTVKARELISTWVVHDFTHWTQIARLMAERYREDVGPWAEYLGVLRKRS